MAIRATDPRVGVGRYLTNLGKTYSDIIKDKQAQYRSSNYQKILKILEQLKEEMIELKRLEYERDSNIIDILSYYMSQNTNQQSLDISSLINSTENKKILINNQQQKVNKTENLFKQALKGAFLFNIEVQQRIHTEAPEFFDFISIRDKNNKTNLFMLDSKQLAKFINQKDLVDFVPVTDQKGIIQDYKLTLLRNQTQNKNFFDNNLLSYLQNKNNAYQLNSTIIEQVFNQNKTYQKFMEKDKFYSYTSEKENKNLGQRTELMLQQLLNGKTVEEAYENQNNILWRTKETKEGNMINVLKKDSEFGGAIGDSLGAIGINRETKEFTFLNKQYTQFNTSGYEKVFGNFQIKSLNLKKDMSTFDFGSASSILRNNNIYSDSSNFQQAKQFYFSWIMADPDNRIPKEAEKDLNYQKDISQAYELARDFVFSFTDELSDTEVSGLDEYANELGGELLDYVSEAIEGNDIFY